MIFNFLFDFILIVLSSIINIIPSVNISGILFIGDDLYNILVQMIRIWNGAIYSFPYLEILNIVLFVIISFELLVLVVKLLLGSRSPIR